MQTSFRLIAVLNGSEFCSFPNLDIYADAAGVGWPWPPPPQLKL